MRKLVVASVFVLIVALVTLAQAPGMWTGPAQNYPIQATITPSTCTTPAVGVTNYCTTGTVGMMVSCNGLAYIPGVICGTVAGGVASISVNGGQPQTGTVSLKIPTTATSTATFASNGAATVTTTIQ
jgi:hypothetical protein